MRQTTPRPPCPNPDCQHPHVVRNGHMSGHQRSRCLGCGAWFGQTAGPPLDRLRTPPEQLARALRLVMRRGSLRAAEQVRGHPYETISHWLHLAAAPAAALPPVVVHDRHLSTLEVDAFCSFVRRRTAPGARPIRPRMVGEPQ